jgi:phage tail-like protein
MANSSENYPVSGYHFEVKMGGTTMAFKEVSGLSATVEYKDDEPGADSTHSPKKFDRVKPGDVTFKKGLVKNTLLTKEIFKNVFELDFEQTNNEIKHELVMVTLKNEAGEQIVNFALEEAYPVKWEMSNFDAMSKELAIETIVIGCASIKIS